MMLTEKLWIFTRIYKQFDPCFSLICYYSFIFGLLRISIGLSVFGFIANEYQWRAIQLLSTIHNIRSAIWWAILNLILNYSRILISKCLKNEIAEFPPFHWSWLYDCTYLEMPLFSHRPARCCPAYCKCHAGWGWIKCTGVRWAVRVLLCL